MNAVVTANAQLFAQITTHMFDVYNGAKHGTLSVWSWPSRYLTRFAAAKQTTISNETFQPYEPRVEELQYVNPPHH